MGEYAIIGMGRFGSSVARTLHQLGHQVLAIDKEEEPLRRVADEVTQAVQLDSTDAEALRRVGITNFSAVVVAIGSAIQESILTTLVLKELGCGKVVAKAASEQQARVLEKVGADVVVRPERDMGIRIAHTLASPGVLDYLELSPTFSIEELSVSERMAGQTLGQLDLKARYGVSILLIRRDSQLLISPAADTVLRNGDVLVVVGENRSLSRLEASL
ncbi:MAG: TrkA family potassium uptake protein [Armatimonadota bacterium]|nr:TrkA family potassium uptake protein [Armatimonadota bacterium]MDR7421348.1 TrkA family potassium uptake protein [Armatimonadota bacterium]MDR7455516.1 TrkA family potassium uptake protein [Armatimonadota bacterium]MDR7456502.1 TrkA family potassium uptake protein [Armatimonadota bacterium]MDR7496231.1 TrkA family potassium uptake protein [Armatimonadota bacterium]